MAGGFNLIIAAVFCLAGLMLLILLKQDLLYSHFSIIALLILVPESLALWGYFKITRKDPNPLADTGFINLRVTSRFLKLCTFCATVVTLILLPSRNELTTWVLFISGANVVAGIFILFLFVDTLAERAAAPTLVKVAHFIVVGLGITAILAIFGWGTLLLPILLVAALISTICYRVRLHTAAFMAAM